MIAINNDRREHCITGWQASFNQILPEIERRLRGAFCGFRGELQSELIQDALVQCLLSYMRLFQKGRAASVSPSSLVWYAARQVKSGRQAGCRLNCREPLSHYARLHHGIRLERLHTYNCKDESWINDVLEDKRASVPDQVAARLDFRAWFGTLPKRTARIARDLALGCSTAELASKYRLSPGRISQMRRSLANSWREFQHEDNRSQELSAGVEPNGSSDLQSMFVGRGG